MNLFSYLIVSNGFELDTGQKYSVEWLDWYSAAESALYVTFVNECAQLRTIAHKRA